MVNKAREESNNKSTQGLQRKELDNAQEVGEQETVDGEMDDYDKQQTVPPTGAPEHSRSRRREAHMVTPIRPSEHLRRIPGAGRGKGRGSNMLGFGLAADMVAQAQRHERSTPMGRSPFEQDKLYRKQKAQKLNGMDIKQLTKQGQEVTQGTRGQMRRYIGLERRDFIYA